MANVSIVIPTYNRARLVKDAIRSALAQTYSSCEVIVVDDGSTDDTPAAVRSFGDAVRYHRQLNSGVEAAINAGTALMTGEYVYVLGDDDLMEPRAVEALLPLLEDHPEAGLAYGRARVLDPEGREVLTHDAPAGRPPGVWSGINELRTLILGNYICGGSMLMRKRLWDALGGFDPSCKGIYEDWDLWVRAACVSAIGYAPMLVLTVRQTPNSLLMQISNERALQTFTSIVDNRRRMLDALASNHRAREALADMWPRLEALYLVDVAQLAFMRGEPAHGRVSLREARRVYPPIFKDPLRRQARQLWLKLQVPGELANVTRAAKRTLKHRIKGG